MHTIQYLLESAFCLATLYALYWFSLRRETFFQWNRAFLLLAPVVAFALPALHIQLDQKLPATTPADIVSAQPAIDLPVLVERAQIAPQSISHALEQPVWSLSLGEVLWWIYFAGLIFFLLHLALQVYRLLRFLKRCRWAKQGAIVLATGPENTPLASFFGFVFWHPGDTDQEAQKLLLEHEMVHVRQWHSLDLILMEILLALQWFNPLLYAYRRSLRTVHEYIADENVVRRTRQRHEYARLLLSWQATGNGAQPGLVNTFHSLIKHRLIMLAKHPSDPLRRVKYLLTLPLFGALLLLFSFRLVEHLPAAKPLHDALQTAENYAARLSEVNVTAPLATVEPTPYIFYWGLLQARFFHETATDVFFAEINTTAKDFRKSLEREPRLWNGKTLEQHLSFSIGKLAVRSDYYVMETYNSYRNRLLEMAADLPEGQTITLEGIPLSNGKTGTIRLFFTPTTPADIAATPDSWLKTPIIKHTAWGEKTLPFGERSFVTVEQFWKILDEKPVLYYLEGGSVTPQKWSFVIFQEDRQIAQAAGRVEDAMSLEQLRIAIKQLREKLQPETQIRISAWDAFKIERDQAAVDTIITFDPETYEEKIQIVNSAAGSAIEYNPLLVTFHLVPENDPRLSLLDVDKANYRFEWGPDYTVNILQRYAVPNLWSSNSKPVSANNKVEFFNHMLTAQDVVDMFHQPAKLFKDNRPLGNVSFLLQYNDQKFFISDGQPSEMFLKNFTQSIKPKDRLVLSGFNTGGISLDNTFLHIEVRSDDPKPALRPVAAAPAETGISLNVSPNPATELAILNIQIPKAGPGVLTVTDAAGIVRYSLKTDFQAGYTPYRLPLAQIKSKGLLVVRLELPYGNGSTKMVVE